MKKTKQRYVTLKLTPINVYTCILLNVTVSGTVFEILTSKVFIWEKQPGLLQFPLSKAKVEGGLFFTSVRKLESDTMLFVGREKWPALSSFKYAM